MSILMESAEDQRRASPRGPLRIVHLVSSLKVGGMERFVLRIAQAQQARGHRVRILALQGGPLEETAGEMGLHVVALRGGMTRRLIGAAFTLARFRPHLLHAHNPSSLHYAVLGKRVSRGRVLMTYHGRGMGDPRTPSPSEWSHTDVVVAVSGATAEVVREEAGQGSTEIAVIRNGIDPTPPRKGREEVRRELALGDSFTGIVAARLDALKDHASLLKALAGLKENGLPVSLLIAGDGPERETLEQLSGQLDLEDQVRFLGFRTDVTDLLAAADFFVLPSTTEGLPLSVLEAMAQSLPVVATRVGGIPELIEHGATGLLVPPKDPTALTEAIGSLTKDPALRRRLGQAAAKRVLRDFSFSSMVEKYDDLYYRLIRSRR